MKNRIAFLLIGTMLGIAIATAAMSFPLDDASAFLETLFQVATVSLLGAASVTAIAIVLAWRAIEKFLSRSRDTIRIAGKGVADAAASALAGDQDGVRQHLQTVILKGVGWYAPIASRIMLLRVATALVVAVGGVMGTALLYRQTVLLSQQNQRIAEQTLLLAKQNEYTTEQVTLLREQNSKIDLQTLSGESQQRAGFSAELFDILRELTLLDRTFEEAANGPGSIIPRILPATMVARVINLARAAIPYRSVELAEGKGQGEREEQESAKLVISERRRSPERGQLLLGLLTAHIDLQSIKAADFSNADLRAASLKNGDLSGLNLEDADMQGADLSGSLLKAANMRHADLRNGVLTGAVFDGTELTAATFGHARMTNTSFRGAVLTSANFDYADLFKSGLQGARMSGASYVHATLVGASFHDADTRDIDLSFARISPAQAGNPLILDDPTLNGLWVPFVTGDVTRLEKKGPQN